MSRLESDINNPDSRLAAQFYSKPVQNAFKSQLEGRPIFEDVDYVRIFVPGDSTLVIDTPVRDDHKARFPLHWQHYVNSHGENKEVGTPINQWPLISAAQAEELRALKFNTVESVATASDAQLQRIGMVAGMSPFAFRDRAKRFLDIAAGEAVAAKQDEENKALRLQLEALQEQVSQLAQTKRGPGRPPRTEEDKEAA